MSPDPLLVSSAAGAFHHRHDLRAYRESLEVIAPPLCHRDPLIPILASSIGTSHCIAVSVGKGALDSVGMPFSAFIQQGAGSCPKPVGSHHIFAEPNSAVSGIHSILAHRLL